jgi:hypothetical protein
MQKNAVGGSKNIPLTAEGIIRHMLGHIPLECRNIFLFFYSGGNTKGNTEREQREMKGRGILEQRRWISKEKGEK